MATVIDALTVTLGLDAAGFKKGQQETREALKATEGAATRTAKTMQAEGGRAAEFFTAAKVEALAFLGVLTGGAGLIAGFKDTAAGLNAINRAALASGESTQFIQAFSAAIGRTGGNIETAKQQLIQFAATVEQFKLRGGNSPLAQYSQVLGIDPTNAKPQEVIEGIMRAIERNPGPQGRQYILNMGAQLGVPNDLMLSLLQIGTLSNLQTAIQRSVELGAVQSEKQIDAAIKFQGAVVEFEQAITGLITSLIPFEALGEAIHNFTEYLIHPPTPPTPQEVQRTLTSPEYFHDTSRGLNLWQWLRRRWTGEGEETPPAAPGGAGAPAGRTPSLDNATRARAAAVEQGLIQRGMDPETARAFAANSVAESGADPASIERGGGPGRGLFQITSRNRKDDYQRLYGHSPEQGSRDEQLDFVMWELANTERGAAFRIAGAHGAEDRARAVSEFYERPADREGQRERRAEIARSLGTPSLAGPRITPLVPAIPYGVTPPSAPVGNSSDLTIHSMNISVPSGDPKHIAATVAQHLAREITNATNTGMA